jgi:hypothetical protein
MDIKFRIQRCLEWSENWRVINHAEMLAPPRGVTIGTPVGVATSHDEEVAGGEQRTIGVDAGTDLCYL